MCIPEEEKVYRDPKTRGVYSGDGDSRDTGGGSTYANALWWAGRWVLEVRRDPSPGGEWEIERGVQLEAVVCQGG